MPASATPQDTSKNFGSASHVAVIGGGISGLTCAFRLAQSGKKVTLYEGSSQLGGLGTFFEHDGRTFEKFYHCMLPSDGPLLALLEDLKLRDETYWKPTTFGYWHDSDVLPLNKAIDLLKFSPLGFIDRLRVGFTGVYGRMVSDKGLDDISAVDWLTKLSGKRAFNTFWKPMLQAKFGDRFEQVPALWFWSRFNREKGDAKGEEKGYIRGGYKRIVDTLEARLRCLGVDIRMNIPVTSVDLDVTDHPIIVSEGERRRFDSVVVTSPWPIFHKSAGPRLRSVMPEMKQEIDYQGVINCLLFLRRPLTPHYWVATPQEQFPFDGAIETSTLTEESDRGEGRHVVYLTKYLHRTDARMAEADDSIVTKWWASLKQVFPDLRDEDLETSFVFKAPFVEPIFTRGYLKLRPPESLVSGRIYLSTTAQLYPTVTAWNGAVSQANRTVEIMQEEAALTPADFQSRQELAA
jgi:protoporphyrinogen oxidase